MNCLITNNQHTIAVLSLFFLLGLAACGDSSSSSDSGTPDDSISDDYTEDGSSEADSSGKGSSKKEDPFLDSKEYKDSSAIGSVINSGMGPASVRTDSYEDYKTIRFGAYEWMAENIKINGEDYEFSICYNDNEKNCDIYGSLLPDSVANSVCPYLFRLPTVDDFKYLVKFAGDVTSEKFAFNPQYAGICRKTDKTLTCSDIRNALNLASSENSYFHLSPSGNVVYAETKDNEYYSVRCLRSSNFVENENFLPACNSQWENELLYVASEKKNFVCKNNGWVKDTSDKCSYLIKGQKEYANDTLYICDSRWRPAELNDLDKPCSKSNEWEIAKLNGTNYICRAQISDVLQWEKIRGLEAELGVCDSSNREKIAVKEDSVHYVCRASGWVEASIAVIYGKCDETNYGRVVNHHPKNGGAVKLICRDKNEDWQSLTDIETLHGICTPTREGDTLLYKDTIYECSAYKWKRVALDKTLGKCDSTIYGNTGTIGTKKYICSANGWIPYDPLIDALGVCQKSIQGTIKTYNGKEYGCGYNNVNSLNKYEWVEESEITDSLGFCLGDKFEWKIYKGKDYSCRYGQVAWKNSSFWGMYLACDNTKYGITVGYEGQHYYCDASLPDSSDAKKGWHAITPMDSTIGICRRDIHLDTATYLGKQYYCGLQEEGCGWRQELKCYTWIPVTATE